MSDVTKITCRRCGRTVNVIYPCTKAIIASCPERCEVSLRPPQSGVPKVDVRELVKRL